MADTFTPHYNLAKPSIGGDPNTWGDLLNENFDIIDSAIFSKLDTAGGTLTGPLILAADPTDPKGAVTKQYADAIGTTASAALPKAGGAMTGQLTLNYASPQITLRPTADSNQNHGAILSTGAAGNASWGLYLGDGSNNFVLNMFNPANGGYIGTPMYINRANQQAVFAVRPSWAGVTPWDTGNFNPAAYQPAGNYGRSADGHNYSWTWDGANIHHYVDGVHEGRIWDERNLNPAAYQPAGNYVTGEGAAFDFRWDAQAGRVRMVVNGQDLGYIEVI